jgi:hypothetical protein
MSSTRRPWYPWYPKDFNSDEKVQALSPLAELLYRRALDVAWQANGCLLLNVCQKLANQIGKGLTENQFKEAWSEIQFNGFELFKTTNDGKWLYSERLRREAEKIENIQKTRSEFGKKGAVAKAKANAKAKAKQKPKQSASHSDSYSDVLDLSKDKSRSARNSSNHFSEKTGTHFEAILSACQKIESLPSKKTPFNVYSWVQKWTNKSGHPGAILETLRGLITYWPDAEKPFAYADTIMRTKNGNFNERDAIEQSAQFKADWKASESVAKLLKGIG